MKMNIKEIAKLEWEKNWSGKFCLLMSSVSGESYELPHLKIKGASVPKSLYIYKEGITTCYLPQKKVTKCFDTLAKEVVKKNELLVGWAKTLRKATDNMKEMVNRSINSFLEFKNYLEFYELYYKYEVFQVTIKIIADYLPLYLIKKYGKMLEEERKYTEPIYDEIEKFAVKLAQEIGKKGGYPVNLITSMTFEEISEFIKNRKLPSKKGLEKRYKLSALYYDNGKDYFITEGVKELEELIAKKSGLVTGKVKGTVAHKGKAKGSAKIINHEKEFSKFREGDVLITSMTRPEFIPLIRKAAAIVTDAGGILCHAAIVAREMKKPCIVGTKVATKAFKDGDLVEVDANKGVVKILKRK